MQNLTPIVSPVAGPSVPAEDESSFASILSEFEQQHHGQGQGQTVQGTVVSISPESVFVDIGRKMDGIIPVSANYPDQGIKVSYVSKNLADMTNRIEFIGIFPAKN